MIACSVSGAHGQHVLASVFVGAATTGFELYHDREPAVCDGRDSSRLHPTIFIPHRKRNAADWRDVVRDRSTERDRHELTGRRPDPTALHGDGTIECAWHGARFDCRSGAVRRPPAIDPLPVYAVRVEQGRVLVGPRIDDAVERSA